MSTADLARLDGTASDFFHDDLGSTDPAIQAAIDAELGRQRHEIELIASENIVSKAVMQAQGSVMTNKYAEGYPGKRYYAGCEHVDVAESLAIERACALYQCSYANVQPHSGAQANQAVFLALLQPGDVFMGMDLAAGGHLTHGSPVNLSGKWFDAVTYGVDPVSHQIDYDALEKTVLEKKPKLIIAGGSAYPRVIDFARFRAIADSVGAYLMVDMAHFSGLVAGGAHPNPLDHAHVVTTTTHKTLRGPRGGMILSRDADVSGGTDTHLVLVDLRAKNVTGKATEAALTRSGITCNKNAIPFDPASPFVTSGVRLGTPAATTRGFTAADFEAVGEMVLRVVNGLAEHGEDGNAEVEQAVKADVIALTDRFPIYE